MLHRIPGNYSKGGAASAPSSGREVLTTDRTYYVRTDGSDSNDGLTNSAGGAFLTIQKAIDVSSTLIDCNGFNLTVQVAAGTYSPSTQISMSPVLGAGTATLIGDAVTPSNVIISSSGGGFAISGAQCGAWSIKGFKISNSVGGLVQAAGGASFTLGAMEYGSTGTNQYQIRATAGGVINFNANYTISGSAGMHLRTQVGGQITYNGGLTITVSGTPSFTEFCHAELCGVILFNSGTLYSGSATGTRYNVSLNAAVSTNGGGANFFPGNAAGTTATGGQYT